MKSDKKVTTSITITRDAWLVPDLIAASRRDATVRLAGMVEWVPGGYALGRPVETMTFFSVAGVEISRHDDWRLAELRLTVAAATEVVPTCAVCRQDPGNDCEHFIRRFQHG